MKSSERLTVLRDAGTGRAFVLVVERERLQEAEILFEALCVRSRVILVVTARVLATEWSAYRDEIATIFSQYALRQASLISFGACGCITQAFALAQMRAVRTLVLVDATTRAHPTRFQRAVDKIESALPLGLPLRSVSKEFDAKPFLQRIRCPVLVVTSPQASDYEQSEAAVYGRRLPTAWRLQLKSESADYAMQLAETVLGFYDVPAKCPQKG